MNFLFYLTTIFSLLTSIFCYLSNSKEASYIWFFLFVIYFVVSMVVYREQRTKGERGFEVVSKEYRKTNGVISLPLRSTVRSAGYDFFSNGVYTVEPNEIVKVWTDVKAYMKKDEVLILDVRSSMGGKWMLANTIGVIDSDYYSNESNDGNIGVFLKNISNETLVIEKGEKIAQGIFIKYLVTSNDKAKNKRVGGFGSTNAK